MPWVLIQVRLIKHRGDQPNVNRQSKVSINDVCCRSVTSQNNIENSEQNCVGLNKNSRTGVVMKLDNNDVSTSEQDCTDFTHVNRFAVLCVDSSEDEGDSLDFDTVNSSDASCTVRGCQGGESVGIHSNLGKKPSSSVKNSLLDVSECQSVVKNFQNNTQVITDNSSRHVGVGKVSTGGGGGGGSAVRKLYIF